MEVIIIGAGVAGITLADRLRRSDLSVRLIEKSRGAGGRMATRQTRSGIHFDHGAQYFTARSDEFRSALKTGYWAGAVQQWGGGGDPIAGDSWYVGAPRMKSALEAAALELNVQYDARIETIERRDHRWVLSGEGLSCDIEGDVVVLSCPAPQAMALTPFSARIQTDLSGVVMEPCWALMIAFDERINAAQSVFQPESGAFSWIAKNSSKPGREHGIETWVAHASPTWSQENLELSAEAVASTLWRKLPAIFGCACPEPIYLAAHRWRYARVARAAEKPLLTDETGSLLAIGDWCLGPRVECAFLSGSAAGKYIEQMISA
ncbi:MAG: FAD-dependent oxidoreductase [Pseudomonadota bacterium]